MVSPPIDSFRHVDVVYPAYASARPPALAGQRIAP